MKLVLVPREDLSKGVMDHKKRFLLPIINQRATYAKLILRGGIVIIIFFKPERFLRIPSIRASKRAEKMKLAQTKLMSIVFWHEASTITCIV